MCDETADIFYKSQMVIVFRSEKNGEPVERFRGFFQPTSFTAQSLASMGVRRKKCRGVQKHSRDGHLSESYSQVSVSDRVTN